MNRLLFALLLLQVVAPQTPLPKPPGNATPGQPAAPSGNASPGQPSGNTSPGAPDKPLDPAAATFTSDGGLLFFSVKPDKIDDYEAAIRMLQEALSQATDESRRAIAQGWRVYKVAEPDAKASVLYIHVIHPVVPTVDYRLSLLLDELLAGAPPELLSKYRDAIAVAPTKLGITEVAHMAVAPKPKPTNTTPGGPDVPGKPGNVSPTTPANLSPAKPGNVSPKKPGF